MKEESLGKIYNNGRIIIIGLSKSVITAAVEDRDVVYTFNLAISQERHRFELLARKYGVREDELPEIEVRSAVLFD